MLLSNMLPQDNIVGIFRSHPLMFIGKWVVIFSVTNTTAFISLFFLNREVQDIILFGITMLLMLGALLISSFTHWWVNTDIITTEKLICIRYHGLFRYSIDEFALHSIQAIDVRQHGVLQNLFGFGNVELSSEVTGGAKIILKNISNIDHLVHLLRRDKTASNPAA